MTFRPLLRSVEGVGWWWFVLDLISILVRATPPDCGMSFLRPTERVSQTRDNGGVGYANGKTK